MIYSKILFFVFFIFTNPSSAIVPQQFICDDTIKLNKEDSILIEKNNLDHNSYIFKKNERIKNLKYKYNWERVGLYLRIDDTIEILKLSKNLGFDEPYCFMKYLRSEEISSEKQIILSNLYKKLLNENSDIDGLAEYSNNELLMFSFTTNPLIKRQHSSVHNRSHFESKKETQTEHNLSHKNKFEPNNNLVVWQIFATLYIFIIFILLIIMLIINKKNDYNFIRPIDYLILFIVPVLGVFYIIIKLLKLKQIK